MKQTITVQVEVDFDDLLYPACSIDCEYLCLDYYTECLLFQEELKTTLEDADGEVIRCKRCIDACKENKDANN